ncbi:gamma-mobile-trio protein GmtX [Pseudoalteromonas sp. MMG013]|uniref:gamma-mobile-trio protein GmtX n=1 Tax=Pseudoalteromonas sp. MMG013 TaxID=2822687 RepID=UPI0024959EFD|nr:gamma-mobile-trio protein GmtX [Pseudoalteromonas sp. MMG013]
MYILTLIYSISNECMERNEWQSTRAGQVKSLEYNCEIFPRGFTTAISKLIVFLNCSGT